MTAKALFFDIDGTLVTNRGEVPDSARRALHMAKKKGHRLFVCSGRPAAQIPEHIRSCGFDGIIGSAGAYGELDGTVLFDELLTKEELVRMTSALERNGACYILQCTSRVLVQQKMIDELCRYFRTDLEGLKKLENLFGHVQVIDSAAAYPELYPDAEKAIYFACPVGQQVIREALGEGFVLKDMSMDNADDFSGEITKLGVTKATGMKKMIDRLGISREDTFAFGDGPNDLEMLSFAGTAVAMGNGVPVVKEISDYVTDDVDKDGILNALKHFGLL